MAETKISGRDYIMTADIDGDSTFKVIACLTSNTFTSKAGTIDGTSKCGNLMTQGPDFDQSFKVEGFAIDETGTPSKDSYRQLYAAHAAGTAFNVKMGPAVPTTGDVVYSASIFISDWDLKADDKDDVKFSATFTVSVPPATQTVTS